MTTEDRAVATRAPTALTQHQPQDDLDAFGELDAEEMVLPTMKLVQGVSRPPMDSQMAGHFFDTLRQDYKPVLHVAILALKRSRSLFVEGDFEAPPLCASDDAVAPREIVRLDMGEGNTADTGPTCARCRFAQWGTAKGGKGKGQACTMAYNLLCYDLDDASIYVLRITGASIMDFRKYFTAGKMSTTPAYAISTVVGSEIRTFAVGQAFVYTFEAGDHLDPDMATSMREQAARYRGRSLGVEGDPDVMDTVEADEFPGDDITHEDIPSRDIDADEAPPPPVRAAAKRVPADVPEGETHLTNCASLAGGKCNCDGAGAPVEAKTEPEDIPFETADDFPPNPPMITEEQKNYLVGGGNIKNADSLCAKWVKHRGGSKPIIEDIKNLHPAIAAGVIFNEKAQILNWRIIVLTEVQATLMIAEIKRELGIKDRKKKEPA